MAWTRVGMAILLVATTGVRVAAEEPFQTFLERLREEGYYDLVEEYIQRMRTSPLAGGQVQGTLELELGRNHLEAAQREPDVRQADRRLQQAAATFQSFLARQPAQPLAADAHRLLGWCYQLRAHLVRKAVIVGLSDTLPPADRDRAVDFFQKARDQYLQAQSILREVIEGAGEEREWDEQSRKQRQSWRAEYVHCRFSAALMLFHQAELHGDRSAELYQQAATEFHDVAGKYRTSYAQGLMAVLYLGRCKRELDDPKLALTYFQEILAIEGSSPVLLDLQEQALAGAMQCWIDPDVGQLDHAIRTAETWLERHRATESSDPEVAGILLQLAVAYQQKAAQPERSRLEQKDLLDKAGRLARQVAGIEGPWRDQGRQMVADLGLEPAGTATRFTTFEDAYQAALQSHQGAQSADATWEIVAQRSGASDDAQQAAAELQEERLRLRKQAREQFQQALGLAGPQTPPEDVHAARYYLALVEYQLEHYAEAAVVADFVLRHAGDASVARYSGRLALAAYSHLLDESPDALQPAVHRRLFDLSEWIVARWPTSDDAYQALACQVAIAASEGDLERLEQAMSRIPRDAPQWAAARLHAGLGSWQAGREGGEDPAAEAQGGEGVPLETPARRAWQARTRQWLTEGLEAWGDQAPTPLTLQAAVRLSSLLVDMGETGEALKWLDAPGLGPRTLLRSGDPLVAGNAGYAEAIQTVAIRAQMGYLGQAQDPGRMVRETAEMVQKLQAQLGLSAEGRQRLLRVYVTLARDLKEQLAATPAAQRAPLIQGAQLFLEQAGRSTDDPQILAWVGDTLLELDALRSALPDPASPGPLVEQAREVYQKALAQIPTAPAEARAGLTAHVQLRLARALARAGQFAQALQVVTAALETMPTAVDLQTTAAEILEGWGDQGNSEAYLQALRGTALDPTSGQPLVWGWARLANTVSRHPQFRPLFYQARLHVARCRLQHALQSDDRQGIEQAKQDVLITFRLYPLPEDPAQRKQFDELLKDIQRRLDEQPTGLASLKR